MWCLETWLSGTIWQVRLMIRLCDLTDLFQLKYFYFSSCQDSDILHPENFIFTSFFFFKQQIINYLSKILLLRHWNFKKENYTFLLFTLHFCLSSILIVAFHTSLIIYITQKLTVFSTLLSNSLFCLQVPSSALKNTWIVVYLTKTALEEKIAISLLN